MHDHGSGVSPGGVDAVLILPFALALILYLRGIALLRCRGVEWPRYRGVLWCGGVLAAAAGFVGPLAAASHTGFVPHMWTHLLVGMLSPLLLVSAAPITLALRCLHVDVARRLSRLLSSRPARIASAPVTALTLNLGGLWALHVTPLFGAMQQSPLVHLLVMLHFLVAGYVFTASIIPVDPSPHRAGFPLRTAVLLVALAGHGILAKVLYANPPVGVSGPEAREGALLMYYGGDAIDAAIIVILCAQWYRRAGRRLGGPVTTRYPSAPDSSPQRERVLSWCHDAQTTTGGSSRAVRRARRGRRHRAALPVRLGWLVRRRRRPRHVLVRHVPAVGRGHRHVDLVLARRAGHRRVLHGARREQNGGGRTGNFLNVVTWHVPCPLFDRHEGAAIRFPRGGLASFVM
ncbi:cytochrome c oxidase assembly protein [Labedella endophytica]|uniref:Cytochrome c oxidase assembly protein n=1 Tax=Labedella endophytica TaxID=1523160 RepID=A0A3S0X9M3_9MICO|nr:cytochrome c oxidase assembly protein [Labedella endophytica]